MNAPKSGLFAIILSISFIIHSMLFMMAGNDLLKQNRMQQANLLIKQLSQDSATLLASENFVALASLAQRYSTLPSVAAIQLYDDQDQQVIIAGSNKTQTTNQLVQDVKLDNKVVGHVELSLRENSNSEIFNAIWWAIVLVFLIHVLLWVIYVILTRPRRSEYMQQQHTQSQIETEILQLKQELEREREQILQIINEYEEADEPESEEATIPNEDYIVLSLKFYDPHQLFRNISPSILHKYFDVCRTLLQRAVLASCEQFDIETSQVLMLHNLDEQGAKISLLSHVEHSAECMMMINSLTQVLFETLHQTFRETKHFSLPICSAVVESSQLGDPLNVADRLTHYLKAHEQAIYLQNEHLQSITQSYQLTAFENPNNAITRHAYRVTAVGTQIADIIGQLRSKILHNQN